MRRRMLLVITALICLPIGSAWSADPAKPLRVCILSGCPTYKSEELLPPFQKWLEENYQVQATRLVRVADDDLPGLEKLDDCDVALVFFKRMKLKGDQLERFKRYVTSGRPVVGVRTASHAVQTWLDFDKLVLGGNYQNHHEVGPVTTIELQPAGKSHPILNGVKLTSAAESLYKNSGHAKDIQVLLTGTIPGQPTEPIAWTRVHNGGRVFYTSLGAAESFANPDFQRMLANALFWTANRDVALKPR